VAFELSPLPYAKDALAPHMSAETLEYHHDKHHRAYVDTLNELVAGTALAERSLEDIISITSKDAAKASIFNNAAQTWNHDFFWRSMRPNGGGEPTDGDLLSRIDRAFGGFDKLREAFAEAAKTEFGSGWAWIILDRGKLKVIKTSNADNPIAHHQVPLVACDVWEHAYYIDYRNRRPDFVAAFLDHLIDWEYAAQNLARHVARKAA
jgi:Fe-Mn family superoxide dismutase